MHVTQLEHGDELRLELKFEISSPLGLNQLTQMSIGQLANFAGELLNVPEHTISVLLRQPSPVVDIGLRYGKEYEGIAFDAGSDSIRLSAKLLERKPHYDEEALHRHFDDYIQQIKQRYPDSLQDQVRDIIGHILPSGECSLERVAAKLTARNCCNRPAVGWPELLRLSECCVMKQKKFASFATSRGVVTAAWVLLTFLPLASARVESWETVFYEDGLSVERRPYAGSALQEIRGVTRLEASLNAVMALLKDAEFNHQWVYRSGGASVLKEEGYARAYVYGIVDAPWPMQDRDTVVRFDYRQEAGGDISITINNFPDYRPHVEGYVRVPDFGGYWRLRPQQGGWVEVTYQVYGDPGGWIPVWVANFAAVTSVTRTLQAMDSAVKRYSNAQSEFVREVGGNDS